MFIIYSIIPKAILSEDGWMDGWMVSYFSCVTTLMVSPVVCVPLYILSFLYKL